MQAPIQRYAHLTLLDRIWRLRANLTACDASYVALAELLGVDVLTLDAEVDPGVDCAISAVALAKAQTGESAH